MHRSKLILFLILLAIVTTRCESPIAKKTSGALQSAGFVAAPELPPVSVDLICDRPACSRASLPQTLDNILPVLAHRPGSELREWLQGDDVTTTTLVGQRVSPSKEETSEAVQAEATRRFVLDARAALQQGVQSAMDAPANANSPIPESITKVARTPPTIPTERRILIIHTDGRYVVRADRRDFECGPLPEPAAFIAALHANAVLPPASLRGIDVVIAGAAVTPVDRNRCAFSLQRARDIERLWVAALNAAGARSVTYLPGVVTASDIDRILAEGGSR